MGCWGITAFESDAGLDAVGFIRKNLPEDGKLELETVIESLRRGGWNAPADVSDGESHTSPMALAEIMVNFMDGNAGGMDDAAWTADDKKFSAVTSFTASGESIQWLRDYLSDTLKCARENAEFKAGHGANWNGWFEEKNWIGWQEHMESLISRLDTLAPSSANQTVDLLSPNVQENAISLSEVKMN